MWLSSFFPFSCLFFALTQAWRDPCQDSRITATVAAWFISLPPCFCQCVHDLAAYTLTSPPARSSRCCWITLGTILQWIYMSFCSFIQPLSFQEYLVTTRNDSRNEEQRLLFSLSGSGHRVEPHQTPTQQPRPNNATPQTSKHPCLTVQHHWRVVFCS